MTEEVSSPATEMEGILRRLEEARQALMTAVEGCEAEHFEWEAAEEESVKRVLERTSDDLNFYYGRLAARAVSLPQPPCLLTAEFGSLREAAVALQVAHRRFTNLLHDLVPGDLEREAKDPEHGSYTLRQVLEMAAAQYRLRGQQVERIATLASAGKQ
ncbi:MAG TPA: DinB family protein [Dehalococcoidia bacterium]|nr:DinB family protein [Dehalococcoidia bacterium]